MSLGITSVLLFLLHGISILGLVGLLVYSTIRFAGNRTIQSLVFVAISLLLFFRVAAPLANIVIASRVPVEAFAFISLAISAATSVVTPISIALLVMAIRRAQLAAKSEAQSANVNAETQRGPQPDRSAGPSEDNPYGPI